MAHPTLKENLIKEVDELVNANRDEKITDKQTAWYTISQRVGRNSTGSAKAIEEFYSKLPKEKKCEERDPARRVKVKCTHCKKPNHTEDQCYKKHPELKGKGKDAKGKKQEGKSTRCKYCGKDHKGEECPNQGEFKCFRCNQWGHISLNCPKRDDDDDDEDEKKDSARRTKTVRWQKQSNVDSQSKSGKDEVQENKYDSDSAEHDGEREFNPKEVPADDEEMDTIISARKVKKALRKHANRKARKLNGTRMKTRLIHRQSKHYIRRVYDRGKMIADSGAVDHICDVAIEADLVNLRELPQPVYFGTVGENSTIVARKIGTLPNPYEKGGYSLRDVYVIDEGGLEPGEMLISTVKLVKDGLVHWTNKHGTFVYDGKRDERGKLIPMLYFKLEGNRFVWRSHLHISEEKRSEIVNRYGSLYELDEHGNVLQFFDPPDPNRVRDAVRNFSKQVYGKMTGERLHARFHNQTLNVDRMEDMVKGFKKKQWKIEDKEEIFGHGCPACIQAKMTLHPMKRSKDKPVILNNDRVHLDMKILPIKSMFGEKCYVAMVDEGSGFISHRAMKQKSEAIQYIKDYVSWASTQQDRKVKSIRMDNAKEFLDKEVLKVIQEKGIELDKVPKGDHRHNGIAENAMRLTWELAHTLLINAGKSDGYWALALDHAIYLLNLREYRNSKKTRFQRWWGFKPNIMNLRVWGCSGWAYVYRKNKSQPKAVQAMYLGPGNKRTGSGFKVMLYDTHRIVHCTSFITDEASFVPDKQYESDDEVSEDESTMNMFSEHNTRSHANLRGREKVVVQVSSESTTSSEFKYDAGTEGTEDQEDSSKEGNSRPVEVPVEDDSRAVEVPIDEEIPAGEIPIDDVSIDGSVEVSVDQESTGSPENEQSEDESVNTLVLNDAYDTECENVGVLNIKDYKVWEIPDMINGKKNEPQNYIRVYDLQQDKKGNDIMKVDWEDGTRTYESASLWENQDEVEALRQKVQRTRWIPKEPFRKRDKNRIRESKSRRRRNVSREQARRAKRLNRKFVRTINMRACEDVPRRNFSSSERILFKRLNEIGKHLVKNADLAGLLKQKVPDRYADIGYIDNRTQREGWKQSYKSEMDDHVMLDTKEFAILPEGRSKISTKTVFDIKILDGVLSRYKSRLVGRGFSQRKGIDYGDVFSPVVSFDSIRIALAFAVKHGLPVEQSDVRVAYLQSELHEQVFIDIPEGYLEYLQTDYEEDDEKLKKKKAKLLKTYNSLKAKGEGEVCMRLKKCLPGLHQSGKEWHSKLTSYLTSPEVGFKASEVDSCVFVRRDHHNNLQIICCYVDDLIMIGKGLGRLKEVLNLKFRIRHLGLINSYLGMRVRWNEDKTAVRLDQTEYCEKTSIRFEKYLSKLKRQYSTPMADDLVLEAHAEGDEEAIDEDGNKFPYMELVGSLLFVARVTRPDLYWGVTQCCRFMSNYRKSHWNAALRILAYWRDTKEMGIEYSSKVEFKKLIAFSDSEFASADVETRKSFGGYCIFYCGAPILWGIVHHNRVAKSTGVAEYYSLSHTADQVMICRNILKELNPEEDSVNEPTIVFGDNQCANGIASYTISPKRCKHVEVTYHSVREYVKEKDIEVKYIRTHKMIADIFTKPLGKLKFQGFRDVLLGGHEVFDNLMKTSVMNTNIIEVRG